MEPEAIKLEPEAIKLVFNLPSRETPGYFKRMRRYMEIAASWDSGRRDPGLIDQMVEFFADYVTAPSPRSAAIDALWEASEDQIDVLMDAFRGNAPSPAVTNSNGSIAG